MTDILNNRHPEHEIDAMFLDRWSPRAISSQKLDDETILRLFESSRWSPSCFNEQPWLFLYAKEDKDLEIFNSILVEKNQLWANKAPLLIYVFARNSFNYNGEPNSSAQFDCGSAWMSLALQARKMGLYAHAMAGFNSEKAYELLNVPKDKYTVMVAIAVGYLGDKEVLPHDMKEKDFPNDRKPLEEILKEGKF
ncbi:MAG: nitroreductase family protein [bacterium]